MYCVFLRICDVAALLCSLLQYLNVIHLHLHDPNSLFMFDAIFRLLLYFSLLVGGWLCVDWFYEIDVCCGAFGLHCDMRVTDALHSGTRTWLANFASISIRHKRASLLYELKSIHTHDALDPLPISPPPRMAWSLLQTKPDWTFARNVHTNGIYHGVNAKWPR